MEEAIFKTVESGIKTGDLGGSASTVAFTDSIIESMNGNEKIGIS